MPGFGRRFAKGGATFYCGKIFTARHMACVSSPLATGYISPTRFLTVAGGLSLSQSAMAPLPDALALLSEVSPMPASMMMQSVPAAMIASALLCHVAKELMVVGSLNWRSTTARAAAIVSVP
jgi:hypothetical protein